MHILRYNLTFFIAIMAFLFPNLTQAYHLSAGKYVGFDQIEAAFDVFSSENNERTIKKIVLDAGHGGKDYGCVAHSKNEKDIVLSIVLELGRMIEMKYPEIEVIYTRCTDVFVPLYKRIKIANESKADLFISVHINSSPYPKVKGSETYVMGLHTAIENLNVAKRENASVLLEADFEKNYDGYDPNSPAGHIILSMYQHAYLEKSIELAQKIEYAFNVTQKVKSRGVKQAGFVVLKKATMPSVLIEAGYLTNLDESQRLSDPNGQNDIARSIFNAIIKYKTELERENSQPSIVTNKKKVRDFKPIEKESLKKKKELPSIVKNPKLPQSTQVSKKKEIQKEEESLVYYVQIAASKGKPLARKGIAWQSIDVKTRVEQGMYKYLVGPYSNLESAMEGQSRMRKSGFKGAFVVVYSGKERINLKKAKEISQQAK